MESLNRKTLPNRAGYIDRIASNEGSHIIYALEFLISLKTDDAPNFLMPAAFMLKKRIIWSRLIRIVVMQTVNGISLIQSFP